MKTAVLSGMIVAAGVVVGAASLAQQAAPASPPGDDPAVPARVPVADSPAPIPVPAADPTAPAAASGDDSADPIPAPVAASSAPAAASGSAPAAHAFPDEAGAIEPQLELPAPGEPLAVATDSKTDEPGTGSDPMRTVETFLERNRRESEEAIRALSQEAEMLRKRLARVEAALVRWQAVSEALKPGSGSTVEPVPALETIPPGSANTPDATPASTTAVRRVSPSTSKTAARRVSPTVSSVLRSTPSKR